ncbi:tetraacyldisaccharide 4'-kinase [Pasteurella canis]|nr:tetraacyldisaccharide 4'-kinase [Pasteurella canis]
MPFWYSHSWVSFLLLPFSCLFGLISYVRRLLFKKGILSSYRAPVPVIIIGNLSVGGNGKTPVVIGWCKNYNNKG